MDIIKKIKDIKRFEQIVHALFKYEFGFIIKNLNLKEHLSLHQRLQKEKFKEREAEPQKIRLLLQELGGAFVKLGQIISLRPDLLPIEYIKELEKLQDEVPAFPFEDVKREIEDEFKKPLNEIFSEFEEKPIAAASIAQVHKAKLKTGEQVAVKVQRPNIKELMGHDIDIMFYFSNLLEKHIPKLKEYNFGGVVKEFSEWTYKELNFKIEAKNARIFKNNFENSKTVYIPKVYEEYTTEKILTLEFLDAVELHDIEEVKKRKDLNIRTLIKNGFDAVLTQIFIHGFFHADPHPGNILVLKNNVISFVDFGIVGYFDDDLKKKSTDVFCGIIENNVDKITNAFLDMGLVADKDLTLFKLDLEEIIKPLQTASLNDIKISYVLEEVLALAHKHKVRFPLDFVLFGKTVVTLEGLALSFDPEFKLVRSSKPFLRKLIKMKTSPKHVYKRLIYQSNKLKDFFVNLPDKTNLFLRKAEEADTDIKEIDKDLKSLIVEMDKSSNRVTLGLIITALVIASAFLMPYNQLSIMDMPFFSTIGFFLAFVLIVVLIASVINEKR